MIDTAKIAQIVGHQGEQTGRVYKITVGRDDLKLKEMGATINARMGLNTWAAFCRHERQRGDRGRRRDARQPEVTPVLKALRRTALDVVAIHNHMTGTARPSTSCTTGGQARPKSWPPASRRRLSELGKPQSSHTGAH